MSNIILESTCYNIKCLEEFLARKGKGFELPLLGRSNVGKSSLINSLFNTKLAKVSKTPGKTQSINFYKYNKNNYIVDLPGYGFAKVPKKVKDNWVKLVDFYLSNSENIIALWWLMDANNYLNTSDRALLDYLQQYMLDTYIILTKADKLKKSEVPKIIKDLEDLLGISEDKIILYSSKTPTMFGGKQKLHFLLKKIFSL